MRRSKRRRYSITLVSADEDRGRYREPERLRGLQVYHELECRRFIDRQICRLGTLEDLIDIERRPAP
jgi:hypothetical protein